MQQQIAMSKNPELELSDSEYRMLEAFERHLRQTGKEPSLRKLAEECGYADQSGARYVRQQLEKRGLMRPPAPPALTEKGRLALKARKRSATS